MSNTGNDQTAPRKRKFVEDDSSLADIRSSDNAQSERRPRADQQRSNPTRAEDHKRNDKQVDNPTATVTKNENLTTRGDSGPIPAWLPPLGFTDRLDLLLLRFLVFRMTETVGIDREELNIRHMCTLAYEQVQAIENSERGEKNIYLPRWRQIFVRLGEQRKKSLLISEEQMLSILPWYHPRVWPRNWSLTPPLLVSAPPTTSSPSASQEHDTSSSVVDQDRIDVDTQ